jgi:hypothetical protein
MYYKGNRQSKNCMDDIVLIQAIGVENDNAIQDLQVLQTWILSNCYLFDFQRQSVR